MELREYERLLADVENRLYSRGRNYRAERKLRRRGIIPVSRMEVHRLIDRYALDPASANRSQTWLTLAVWVVSSISPRLGDQVTLRILRRWLRQDIRHKRARINPQPPSEAWLWMQDNAALLGVFVALLAIIVTVTLSVATR